MNSPRLPSWPAFPLPKFGGLGTAPRRRSLLAWQNPRSAKLIYANALAKSILGDRRYLKTVHGVLETACVSMNSLLRGAMTAVIDHGIPQSLKLNAGGDSAPTGLVLTIIPFSGRCAAGVFAHHTKVLILARDLAVSTLPTEGQLVQRFALTQAEAHLARSLADGCGLDQFAQRGGVTIATVRTQLKAIFAKANSAGRRSWCT
jgi:DNA-binding CsgD family transcriptional regulator